MSSGSQRAPGKFVEVEGLRIHYTDAGEGEPAILLHGWPTSAFLWRNITGHIARRNRAIAIDLPGFGWSDKPLDASYSFPFYDRILQGFLDALKIDATGLAVHDLGGPIGLYWACKHPERLTKLALLNTLVYPEFSWAVIVFGLACRLPGVRHWISSPAGLRFAIRFGVTEPKLLPIETIEGVQAPFVSADARRALVKAGTGLHPKGFVEIAAGLPSLKVPVRIIYGERDRILPDVGKTMCRVSGDLPQAEVTALPDCGHFLQEERPDEVGRLLADFFAGEGGGG